MVHARKLTYADGTTPRVCIVGAGVGGICVAVQLKRKLNLESFVVFEKAADVGGVWLANKYPGCQVDVPGFVYSYSFAKSGNWSQMYPDRDEVWAYLKEVCKKYDIYSHAEFNTQVISAVWKEVSKTWAVTTVQTDGAVTAEERVQEFDVVIIGTGPLRKPNYPPVFDKFSGPKMHSACWDSSKPLEGRVVGVVGCGSSAVQVIPSIAPKVKKLIVYMREPSYVAPKPQIGTGRMVKWLFNVCPFLLSANRALTFLLTECLTSSYDEGSLASRAITTLCKTYLGWNVKDGLLRQQLTPVYKSGYKAPIGFSSYFKTFQRDNVQLARSPVQACEGQTVITEDGKSESLDVLILCTGFKPLDFFAPMQIYGKNGVDLLRLWNSGQPSTFYGCTCHEAPNLFFLLGPNGISGTNGVMFNIECQARFIVHALRELMVQNAGSICVSERAQAECMAEINEAARNKVYMQSDTCAGTTTGGSHTPTPTWLRTENGFPLLWPKSNTVYWLRTRRLDPNKFEFSPKYE